MSSLLCTIQLYTMHDPQAKSACTYLLEGIADAVLRLPERIVTTKASRLAIVY